MSTLLTTLAGIGVGAIVTFFVSRYYYRQASEELGREVTRLRRAVNMVIIGLVEAGRIKPESVMINPDTRLVDFVRVSAGKMRQMTMLFWTRRPRCTGS